MRARCIVANHPAHRRAFSRSRIGAKHQIILGGDLIEVRENDARFNGCSSRIRVNVDDMIQPARAIQYQSLANRLPSQLRSGTTRQNRNAILCRKFNHRMQIVLCARKHNAERLDLINGRISTIQNFRTQIESNVAGELLAKLIDKIGMKSHEKILTRNLKNTKGTLSDYAP